MQSTHFSPARSPIAAAIKAPYLHIRPVMITTDKHILRTAHMAAFDTTRTTYGSDRAASNSASFISTLISKIVAWNDVRTTRKALSALSDRELEDIGLSRGDVDSVAISKITR